MAAGIYNTSRYSTLLKPGLKLPSFRVAVRWRFHCECSDEHLSSAAVFPLCADRLPYTARTASLRERTSPEKNTHSTLRQTHHNRRKKIKTKFENQRQTKKG